MAKLTFTGRSKDGRRLLLVDESGQEHTVAIDARLRRAVSGTPESTGQLEIPMESSLRPRDIQTRIRAGETPEAVAHAAGTSVEKIMPFAAPVLAERAHVAERALLASVRRRASESGARTLGDAVGEHLRTHNVDPATIEWDAWRREDGRWTLTGRYDVAGRSGSATFSHDVRGNYVTIDDADARWLVGDLIGRPPVDDAAQGHEAGTQEPNEQEPDELSAARQRRLTAVGDDAPLGDDAIELVTNGAAAIEAVSPSETTMEIPDGALGTEQSVEAYLEGTDVSNDSTSAPAPSAQTSREPAGVADVEPSAESAASESAQPESKPKPARKRGRASVPSWDEIMFGGGKSD